MRVRVGFLQPLNRHVRVNLRGRKTGMAKQRLHAAQIGAAIEHVGGETMSKFVRADRNRNRCVSQITLSGQAKLSAVDIRLRDLVYEERSRMHVGCCAIARDRFQRGKADRTNAFLAAFAEHATDSV